ncbi:MAG: transporter substrate-binding domain-containing protein [Anaerolineaceae bacterium]|nr:transporter substrate-binding domain-containing protein [Anaerolineaceae bacterium]
MKWTKQYRYFIFIIGGMITGAAIIFLSFDMFHLNIQPFFDKPIKFNPEHSTITVGFDDSFPPHEYLQNGEATGYNIDIMRAVADAIGYNVEFSAKPWNEIVTDLNNGEIDILSGMFISDARKESYTFSTPHSFVSAGLFSKQNQNIHSLNDLIGKSVLVQQDDIMDDYLKEQALNIDILHTENPAEAINELIKDQADAALLSSIAQGEYFISQYDDVQIDINSIDESPRKYAFAALKENQAIIDLFNSGLIKIKSSGEFDAINAKWFFHTASENNIFIIKNITYILFLLVLLLVASFVWSNSLRKQVALKTEDLLQSQNKFRIIIENASDGVIILHQGKLIFANPMAMKILEISESEMGSFDVFSKTHPIDYARIKGYYKDRLAGNPVENQYTFRILTNNNQERWIMNNVIMTEWEGKVVHLVFFTDITELRESEAALERSEERQKLALEASNDAIWDFNLLEGDTYFSPQFYTMLDYELDEFPANFKSWMDLIHVNDRGRCIKILNGYLDAPDNISHELTYRMETKNGNYRWILSKFKVTAYETGTIPRRMSGIHTDITLQKEFEETLRKEKDVLNQIMHTSNNAFIVTDKEGYVQYINPTAQHILLPDGSQAIGRNFIDFNYKVFDAAHEEELSSQKLLDVLRNGKEDFIKLERVVETDESIIHVLVNVAKLQTQEGEFDGMVISMVDITESEAVKKELIDREKRIRQIIEFTPIGIVMLDTDLNVLTVSEHFVQDFHLSEDIPELINLREYAPLIFNRWPHIFEAGLEGKRQGNLQDPFTQEDGTEEFIQWICCPWFKSGSEIGGILFYTEVITDEVLAYDALQQSEDKFAKTFHTSPDAITITRLEDGLYLDINYSFTELTGYKREDVIGSTIMDINIWQDFEGKLDINERIKTDGEISNFHAGMRMKNGEIHHALISARSIDINHERCLITIGRDISEIIEANEKIQRMNLELEEKIAARTIELERKNQELETFTYTVSHDLKAPLRGIDGYSRLLLEDYHDKLDEDGRYFLENIRNSTSHMDKLINDLLDYSRLERRAVALKKINLKELINRIIHEYLHTQKGTQLIIDLQEKEIYSDYESLLQILRNLIDNAYKFSRKDAQHQVNISSYLENSSLFIRIKDNGIGFDNKYKENIFKIFNRLHTQEDYPGTGIGLTIVKKGIERIGASIIAEGELNQGAEFIISIPQNAEDKGMPNAE